MDAAACAGGREKEGSVEEVGRQPLQTVFSREHPSSSTDEHEIANTTDALPVNSGLRLQRRVIVSAGGNDPVNLAADHYCLRSQLGCSSLQPASVLVAAQISSG